MAIVYGVNNTKKYISNPSEKIPAKEETGKGRYIYDSYVFLANVMAVNDTIELMKLPKGAKIMSAVVKSPSLGTTGIFDLGIKTNGVEAADADFFVASADAGGQAVQKTMFSSLAAGLFVELSAETQVLLKCTEATDAALGLKIEVVIEYSVE